jgi:hypothetical protein
MNIEEENKAKEFYLKSDVEGIHQATTGTVEINYLDMLKLMHSYALNQRESLPIDIVSNAVPLKAKVTVRGVKKTVTSNNGTYEGKTAYQLDYNGKGIFLEEDFEEIDLSDC